MASLWLAGIASAQDPVEVIVTAKEFTVAMDTTTVPANTPFKVVVTNMGAIAHEIVLEKAGAVDEPLEFGGNAAEIEDIDPGATKSAVWTITEPGQYQLACHVTGHFEAGMVQVFTVVASASPAPAPAPASAAAVLPVAGGVASLPVGWILAGLVLLAIGLAVRYRWVRGR